MSGGEDGKINVWASHSHGHGLAAAADTERRATVALVLPGAGKRTHSMAEEDEADVQVQHVGPPFFSFFFSVLIRLP